MDCDADAGNGPCADPNAGTVPTSLAVNIEISQQSLNHLAQPIDIGLQPQPETIERQNGIEGQLAGNVQQAATSPIHPADAPAPDLKLTRIAVQMAPTSFSTNGDEGRMLAENQSRRVRITGDLKNQSALQRERGLELHQSQHVHLQHRIGVSGNRKWKRLALHGLISLSHRKPWLADKFLSGPLRTPFKPG